MGEESIGAPVWKRHSNFPLRLSRATRLPFAIGSKQNATVDSKNPSRERAEVELVLPVDIAAVHVDRFRAAPLLLLHRCGLSSHVYPPGFVLVLAFEVAVSEFAERDKKVPGSDFPVPLNRSKIWPRWIPLLGPERTLVKAAPTPDPYTAWAAGVKAGKAIVTNGPLVELSANGNTVTATAAFYRPLLRLEIVRNGAVIASATGNERHKRLSVNATLSDGESSWVAARVTAQKLADEPDIQAHTNPIYMVGRNPVPVPEARRGLAARWKAELDWYRSGSLEFASEALQHKFFQDGEQALKVLSSSDR